MNSTRTGRLFELYQHIHIQYHESDDRVDAAKHMRNMFRTKRCIYVPLGDGQCKWALPDECVWKAPLVMRTKYALERLYQTWIGPNGENNSIYLDLFRSMIGIEDCTWETLIDELRELKASKCDESDRIGTIYKALDALRGDPSVVQNDRAKYSFMPSPAMIFLRRLTLLLGHPSISGVWRSSQPGQAKIHPKCQSVIARFLHRVRPGRQVPSSHKVRRLPCFGVLGMRRMARLPTHHFWIR
ncbi:hypothetical protein LY76DRAFT_426405 [Colletotrichum caudatum]|nr:hypothetical protein LY76DRAFT_426405 [Colletotrichum caudatum]